MINHKLFNKIKHCKRIKYKTAGEILGESPEKIRQLVKEGKLKRIRHRFLHGDGRVGYDYYIDPASLQGCIYENNGVGNLFEEAEK